jgi:two-component system, cell cycle sensor histidine kinase and response regulator CckA
MRVPDFHPPWASKLVVEHAIPLAMRTGNWTGESAVLDRDGGEIPVSQVILAQRMPDGRVGYLATIMRDIREEKESRLKLERSERKYRTLFEDSRDAVLMGTTDGRLMDINPAGVQLLGCESKDEALSLNPLKEVFAGPAESARFLEAMDRQGFVRGLEASVRRKDGKILTVLITATGLRDVAGAITGWHAILADITEHRRLEKEHVQAQKMEAVGLLASGVAHDFNNILTVITSHATFLLDDVAKGTQQHNDLLEVSHACARAATLTRQLLAFGGRRPSAPQELLVDDAVHQMARMLCRLLGDNIRLKTDQVSCGGCLCMDPGQLEQILVNLAVNARDAMPVGGLLTISTTMERRQAPHEHDMIVLSIADNYRLATLGRSTSRKPLPMEIPN